MTPLPNNLEPADEQISMRLPRIALGMGFTGLAIPLLDVAALITGGIALGNFDERHHDPDDQKRAIKAVILGIAGLVLKGCVLGGIMLWLMAAHAGQPPQAPSTAETPSIPASGRKGAYYYDLGTGQLFVAQPSPVTPIDAPSGTGKGVRAFVVSCGSCSNQSQRFIGWLERNTEADRKVRDDSGGVTPDEIIDALQAQIETSEDQGKTWTRLHQVQYIQYQLDRRRKLCPNGFATDCKP